MPSEHAKTDESCSAHVQNSKVPHESPYLRLQHDLQLSRSGILHALPIFLGLEKKSCYCCAGTSAGDMRCCCCHHAMANVHPTTDFPASNQQCCSPSPCISHQTYSRSPRPRWSHWRRARCCCRQTAAPPRQCGRSPCRSCAAETRAAPA
jgi:hypothetical protein